MISYGNSNDVVGMMSRSFGLKYYASGKDSHGKDIAVLLSIIAKNFGIRFKIEDVCKDAIDYPRGCSKSEEEIYRTELEPQSKILKRTTGLSVKEEFIDPYASSLFLESQ